MSADFCTSIDCPLNQVTLDERSDGLELIIGFVSSSHQSGYVFTPSQISTISNEVNSLFVRISNFDFRFPASSTSTTNPVTP